MPLTNNELDRLIYHSVDELDYIEGKISREHHDITKAAQHLQVVIQLKLINKKLEAILDSNKKI